MTKLKGLLVPGLIIIFIASLLRFVNLNSLPIFADESIYIHWAQIMRSEPSLRFLPLSDGKQPLYMWAVIPFLKIIMDPLIAGRVLSGLCGLATVVGIFSAAQILFKRPAISLLSAFIWAVLPYTIFFERMALVDSMLTMFVVWTFVFSSLAIIQTRLDFSLLAGFTLGFALLTKSPAVFSLILIPILYIFYNFKSKTPVQLIKSILNLVATYIVATAMYNILRLGPEFGMLASRTKDYFYPISDILKHPWWPLLPHLSDDLSFFGFLMTPVALILSIWGIFAGKISNWRERLVLSLWWLVPLIAQSAVAISLTARYFLFTLPFAVILLAYGLLHLWRFFKNPTVVWITLSLLLVPTLLMDYFFLFNVYAAPLPRIERSGYLEEWTAGTGIREVSAMLKSYASNGPVTVGSEGFFGTPFDALGAYLNRVPNTRVIGIGVDVTSVSEKLTNSLVDNQVFLVVNSTRFHVDPDLSGLKLLASFPKGISPDGKQEKLLFFQVLPHK